MSQYSSATDEPVAAPARLKQKGLTLDLFETFTSTQPRTISESSDSSGSPRRLDTSLRTSTSRHRSLKLTTSLLTRGATANTSIARQLAYYDAVPVLVEWKSIDKDYTSRLSFRVERLSALLNELIDPSFHSLRCQGYVKDQISDRYGYVFELPATVSSPRSERSRKERALHSMWNLRGLLSQPSTVPSLNIRVILAITLLETIVQLHTAGWLHKGIRSDNILFFNHTINHWMSDDTPPELYLAGYVYARADNPLELTETPASQYESDLYRHPQSIGPARTSYCKAFDLYGLGCVLLELGLWSPMLSILSDAEKRVPKRSATITPTSSSSDVTPTFSLASHRRHGLEDADVLKLRQKLLRSTRSTSIRHLLEARTGDVYTEVVTSCLFAEVNTDPEVDDPESSLAIQENSLAQLKAIAV